MEVTETEKMEVMITVCKTMFSSWRHQEFLNTPDWFLAQSEDSEMSQGLADLNKICGGAPSVNTRDMKHIRADVFDYVVYVISHFPILDIDMPVSVRDAWVEDGEEGANKAISLLGESNV